METPVVRNAIVKRETIKELLAGKGPFSIRTAGGKEFKTTGSSRVVMVGRFNLIIENPSGDLTIIDPHEVIEISKRRRK